ncbi:MAG: B12-binding domain-containing radical SAM protein [Actinobacteria bacterium]|nr:B12-binding domain-containing radical SAM protein [Actinomycetota bacterium]
MTEIKDVILIEPRSPGLHVFSRYKLPRLGLPLIGALLERELGIRVKIFFQETTRVNWSEIAGADLVGISTITSTAPEAYSLLGRVKSTGDIPVVMGGPHVSFLPEEALERGADFVVRGEGEETILELVKYLSSGEGDISSIPGLSYTEAGAFHHNDDRPHITDLSSLPWPDLSLIEGREKSKIVPVITSRGCPFDCTFCAVTSMFGRRYRFRDTDDIIAELEHLYSRNPQGIFFFYDDNFTASPSHTKELLTKMKEKGITPRWTAQARVDVVKDEELMRLMRETNCLFLYLGLESINPATLEAYRKSQTVEDIIEAVKVIHEHRIKVHGMFVLGSDEDDRATIRETVRFAKKTGIDTVQFLVLTPLPGTEFYREMCRQDRIFITDWSKFSGHHVVFYPKKMSAFQLQKEASLRAMRKFYSLGQAWKLGMLFRWKDMAVRVYAHHVVVRWKSMNRDFLAELKKRYKAEKARDKDMNGGDLSGRP